MRQAAYGLRDSLETYLRGWIGTDYFLTQLLRGHGGFQYYLNKIGKARSPDYVFCNGVVDNVHHIFFLWKLGWDSPTTLFNYSPGNIFEELLRSADRWSGVAHYVRVLLDVKRMQLERRRLGRMAGDSLN